jgi:hypothetical protein
MKIAQIISGAQAELQTEFHRLACRIVFCEAGKWKINSGF